MRNREIKVVGCGFALLRQTTRQLVNETFASPDNETTSTAAAGIMELRKLSFTLLRQTKDKCRKTKGRAVAGITELRICGITEIELRFATPDYKTTRQLVGRQPDLWIYGIMDRAAAGSKLIAHNSKLFYTFSTL